MAETILFPRYAFNGGGLDTSTPSPYLSMTSLASAKNVLYSKSIMSPNVLSRNGTKAFAYDTGALGPCSYTHTSLADGSSTTERLSVGATISRIVDASLTIAYTGTANSVYVNFYVLNSSWHFQIIEDGEVALSYDVGTGEELSPTTLRDLADHIDSLADYSTTLAAAYDDLNATILPVCNMVLIEGGSLALTFQATEEIPTPVGSPDPFSVTMSNRGRSSFSRVDFVNVRNVVIFSSAYDFPVQYDSKRVFRVGMPSQQITATATGSGSFSGAYDYKLVTETVDGKGNIITGTESLASATASSHASINVSWPNVDLNTGFNTDMASVNGSQTAVTTIAVSAGHNLQEGDVVYLLDRASSTRIATQRIVSEVTATTVKISGAAVDVSNGDTISLMCYRLYRTKGQALYYELAVLPGNYVPGTTTFTDNIADGSLGGVYIEQAVSHDLPPKAAYLTNLNGIILYSGILDEPNTVCFSDQEGPWYVPREAGNSFDVYSPQGGKITGMFAFDQYVIIGFSGCLFQLVGSLVDRAYVLEPLTYQYGLLSHFTFAEIGGEDGVAKQILFLSEGGVCALSSGAPPVVLSTPITPSIFYSRDGYNLFRSVGVNWRRERVYLLYLPVEDSSGGLFFGESTSAVYVYDYRRNVWLGPWTQINMSGGACQYQDDLFWSAKVYNSSGDVEDRLYEFLIRDDVYSQADGTEAIPFELVPGWMGSAEEDRLVNKRFNRLELTAVDPVVSTDCSLLLKFERDGKEGVYTGESVVNLTTAGGELGFGINPFGAGRFGDPTGNTRKIKIKGNKAHTFRVSFFNSQIYQRVVISSVFIEVHLLTQDLYR